MVKNHVVNSTPRHSRSWCWKSCIPTFVGRHSFWLHWVIFQKEVAKTVFPPNAFLWTCLMNQTKRTNLLFFIRLPHDVENSGQSDFLMFCFFVLEKNPWCHGICRWSFFTTRKKGFPNCGVFWDPKDGGLLHSLLIRCGCFLYIQFLLHLFQCQLHPRWSFTANEFRGCKDEASLPNFLLHPWVWPIWLFDGRTGRLKRDRGFFGGKKANGPARKEAFVV